MSKRIVLSATEPGELVLRLLRKEATAGDLAREAGGSPNRRCISGAMPFRKVDFPIWTDVREPIPSDGDCNVS